MATGLPAPLHRRAARNRSIDRRPVRSFDRGLWMWTGLIDETVSLVGRQSSGAVCVSWNKQSTCVTNVRSRTRRNLESPSFADFRPPDASASCASAIIRIERRRTRARRGSTAGKAAAPFKDPFGTPGIDRGRRHRPPRRVARCLMCGPSTFAAAAATWEATSIEPLAAQAKGRQGSDRGVWVLGAKKLRPRNHDKPWEVRPIVPKGVCDGTRPRQRLETTDSASQGVGTDCATPLIEGYFLGRHGPKSSSR